MLLDKDQEHGFVATNEVRSTIFEMFFTNFCKHLLRKGRSWLNWIHSTHQLWRNEPGLDLNADSQSCPPVAKTCCQRHMPSSSKVA